MKKLIALILAIMMLASMSVVAFADDPDPGVQRGDIIIENTDTHHTYVAYEIIAGNVVENASGVKHLENIRWGCNLSDAAKVALCTKYGVTIPAGETANDMAATVAGVLQGKNATGADDFAQFLRSDAGYLSTSPVAAAEAVADGNKATIHVHHQGYYLVIDKDNSLEGKENVSYTDNILVVVGENDVKVAHKNTVPQFGKKVQENGPLEDGVGNTDTRLPGVTIPNQFNDTADYAIGDTIHYELVATVNAQLDRYDNYKMIFTDEMKGMTYADKSLRVVLRHSTGDVELASNAYDRSIADDGKKLTVSFDMDRVDGKFILPVSGGGTTELDAGTVVVVYYDAVLGQDATVGLGGNKNTASLQFSNDPNHKDSLSKTPIDTNIVYTYALNVIKQNAETKEKLADAGFKLQRTIVTATGTTADPNGWAILTPVMETVPAPTATNPDATKEVKSGYKIAGWTTEDAATEFKTIIEKDVKIIGLDKGHYFLKETTAPDGYSALTQPIELAITARIGNTQGWDGNVTTLTELKLSITDPNRMSAAINDGNGDIANGTVGINIANNATAQLPTTGGMGTTMFYVFGAILAVGAAVLLITKRRMAAFEM